MRLLFSALLLASCLSSRAQTTAAAVTAAVPTRFVKGEFFGNESAMYQGVYLKIDPASTGGLNHTLYPSLEQAKKTYASPVAYPGKYDFVSEKDSLLDKVFQVTEILTEKYKTIFRLRNTGAGPAELFFIYDPRYDFNFPFLTSEIPLTEAYLKGKIDRSVDEMTDEVRIATPVLEPMSLIRYIKKGKVTTYLSLTAGGSTLNVGEKGVIVLFTDGSKWTRPAEKVKADAAKNGYEYSSFLSLTPQDVALFKSKTVKAFRLYIYDRAIEEAAGARFRALVGVASEMK